MDILEKLTKEDLIKVIANMHDTIQDWDKGWGLSSKESDIMIKIGGACTEYCSKQNDFKLPNYQKSIINL